MALHLLGDMDAALLNAELALKLAPTMPEANFNLGVLLVERGARLGEAIRRLTRVEAEFPVAALLKADAFLQRGETAEASGALRSFMQSYRPEAYETR